MRDVNLERLRALAGQLQIAVRELGDYRAVSADEFVTDRRSVNSAKYLLIAATEAALYWKVDDREVHRVISDDLGDLDEYLLAVGAYLGRDLR